MPSHSGMRLGTLPLGHEGSQQHLFLTNERVETTLFQKLQIVSVTICSGKLITRPGALLDIAIITFSVLITITMILRNIHVHQNC